MTRHTIRNAAVALLLAAGLVLPTAATSNAAYPPQPSTVTATAPSKAAAGAAKVVRVKVAGNYVVGATVTVTVGGKTFTGIVGSNGIADVRITAPKKAGKYKIVSTVAGKRSSTNLVVGKQTKVRSVKVKRGAKQSRVTGRTAKFKGRVKVIVKRGGKTIVNKNVRVKKNGKFAYKFNTKRKGKYQVTVRYVANKKYFAKKTSTTFRVR